MSHHMISNKHYFEAIVAGVGLGGLALTLGILGAIGVGAYLVLRLATALRNAYRRWRHSHGRHRSEQPSGALTDPTVILQRLDAEMSHVTPQYVRRLSEYYLVPGENFRS